MKQPLYSIDDLEGMLDFYSAENIADALKAAGVPLIYDQEPADLSGWKRSAPSTVDGKLVAVRGRRPYPDPDEVMVAACTLPDDWRRMIEQAESSFEEGESLLGEDEGTLEARSRVPTRRDLLAHDLEEAIREVGDDPGRIMQKFREYANQPGSSLISKDGRIGWMRGSRFIEVDVKVINDRLRRRRTKLGLPASSA